jgi:putative flippase GtrA
MSLAKQLIAKYPKLFQLFCFCMVGGTGLIINLCVTYFFTQFAHLWYFFSYLIGTIVSWTCSFFLNARFTFATAPKNLKSWISRYVIFIGGYLAFFWINAGLVYILTSLFGVSYLISIIIGAVLTMFGTFTLSRTIIFAPEDTLGESKKTRWSHQAIRERGLVYVRKYLVLFFIAIAVGGVTVAPQLYFMLHAPSYSGIALMGSDAEEHYVAQTNQVYDGYPTIGDTFLTQKDIPYFQPPLGQIIVAGIGKVLDMDAVTMNVFSKFLFPFLIVILVTLFVYRLTGSYAVGILAGPMVVLGDSLVSDPSAWKGLFIMYSGITGFLGYARPINPEVSALFLFAALWIYQAAFLKRRQPKILEMIVLGVLIGASLYISLYVCTFMLVLGAFGAVWFLYRKEFVLVWASCAVGLSAAVSILPFIINYLHLFKSPFYQESAIRQGLVLSHAPTLSIWLILLLVSSVFFWPKKFAAARSLVLLSTLTLLFLGNQQILTGHSLQPSHYHWYITKPFVGIVLSIYIVYVAERFIRSAKTRVIIYAAVILVLFYQAVLVDINSYRANAPVAIANQAYAPVFAELNTFKIPQGVWADSELSLEIPLYTRDAAPDNGYLAYYLVPQQFLVNRLLLEYKLRGIKPADAYGQMQQDRATISGELYGTYWRDQAGSYAAIPDSLLQSYATQYSKIYATSYDTLLKELDSTQVVWDRTEDPEWKLSSVPGLTQIYSDSRFTIYQVQ